MSILGIMELAVGAAMLFCIAIAVIIMSIRWLRRHVPTENRNDGLPRNSDPPPANHVVEIAPQILFLTQGEDNEDTAGKAQPEKQSAVIHPYPITQPRPTSTLANRRRLMHVLSLNSYMFEHPSRYVVNSMVEDPLRPPTNNAPPVASLAGQQALLFSPRPPVYHASILGGPNNRKPPPPLEDIHVKDVFPVPPVPTPKTRHGVVAWPLSSKSLRHFSGTIFGYQELEKATNGFSQENFLGCGGFGSVYRGTLSTGAEIAVKWLRPDSQRMEQEFEAEVDTISHIRHTHLVSMIGCCVYGDVRLLVYEFVPNNTLHFHLHGEGRPTIDWPTRVKIAQGSAKGLTFLHESCVPRIIHRDIKACNILIDFEFNAKVADFGLAKLFPNSFTHLTTQLAGTFGYMDLEYYSTGKLTEKSDVYSFGVMLLELITGRKPKGLALWAKGESPDEEHDYDSLVDPRLQGNFNAEEMARMVACAAACTRRYGKGRPSMSQVVRILKGEGSLDELNHGINQFWDNSIGQFDGDLKKFWKNAFVSPNTSPTNAWGMSLNSPN